jgi:hypothetical protein
VSEWDDREGDTATGIFKQRSPESRRAPNLRLCVAKEEVKTPTLFVSELWPRIAGWDKENPCRPISNRNAFGARPSIMEGQSSLQNPPRRRYKPVSWHAVQGSYPASSVDGVIARHPSSISNSCSNYHSVYLRLLIHRA